MSSALLIAGSVFVSLAALIHGYIFVLESVLWTKPSTWRVFGLKTQADAETVRPMAFNQGFYNAFLAAGILVGLVLAWSTTVASAGWGITLFGAGSMVAAALVLITSSPALARAALIQGVAPLIGTALIVAGLVSA